MPFHVTCTCGRLVVVPDNREGSMVPCPRCDRLLRVPDKSDTPDQRTAAGSDDARQLPVIEPLVTAPAHGSTASDRHLGAVYLLAIALVLIALMSVVPLLLFVFEARQHQLVLQLPRWIHAILLAGLLQCAYVVYLVQLPDWSAVRVISILALVLATAYATFMGIRLLAAPDNSVIRFLQLGASHYGPGQQAGWCLVMVLLYAVLSYFSGRFSGRWQRREKYLTASR